jgi:hypothetical protein
MKSFRHVGFSATQGWTLAKFYENFVCAFGGSVHCKVKSVGQKHEMKGAIKKRVEYSTS